MSDVLETDCLSAKAAVALTVMLRLHLVSNQPFVITISEVLSPNSVRFAQVKCCLSKPGECAERLINHVALRSVKPNLLLSVVLVL